MSNKHKHMDYIQSIIQRLASNSFMIKGWTITILSALFVFLTPDDKVSYIGVLFIPIFSFWVLDGYFLYQERIFRNLYDSVSSKTEDEIDFKLKPIIADKNKDSWMSSIVSSTLLWFYLPVLLVSILVLFLDKISF